MKSAPNQQSPSISELFKFLNTDDVDILINVTGFLQHITYQNENNKELVRSLNGVPVLISLLKSPNSIIQKNVACILRNMSHGPNMKLKKVVVNCGIIEIIESMIETNHHSEQQLTESLAAILCNLSCCTLFHNLLSDSILVKCIQLILLPVLGLKINHSTKRLFLFKISELSISYGLLLQYLTSFLKNMSSGPRETRKIMRTCEGLVDSITAIVQYAFDKESKELNGKTVENCICILRNLCYSLQEMYESSNEDSNKMHSNTEKMSTSKRNLGFSNSHENIHFSNPRQTDIGGQLLLWNSELIDILLEVINFSKNFSTVEAAIGTIQNLSACKWKLSEEFRLNFRKKKGLPALVMHVINGPDKIVKASIVTLRNLAEDSRNLELIGEHGLIHMLQCLPTQTKPAVKRIIFSENNNHQPNSIPEEYLSLNTMYSVLSFIYFLLYKNSNLCDIFVKKHGIKICMFLLSSDSFYRDHLMRSDSGEMENVDKLPIVAAGILRFIWNQSRFTEKFKKDKLNCEDFCVRSNFQKMKLTISCTAETDLLVYYGKPYIKARANTLIPIINTPRNTPKIIFTRDFYSEDEMISIQKNNIYRLPTETESNLNVVDNEVTQKSDILNNKIPMKTKYKEREVDWRI